MTGKEDVSSASGIESIENVSGCDKPIIIIGGNPSSLTSLSADENSKQNGHVLVNLADIEMRDDESITEKSNLDDTAIQEWLIDNDKEGLMDGTLNDVIPVPPDGGYGWVIVFAAFMSNFVVDGIANSFGAFMSIYQEYFHASKAKVSLIGSLLIGSYLLIGPVAGGLVNKYGARVVVLGGAVIAGLSFFASIVCSNIYVFMAFYGFLGGSGFGLIYLPSIVTVGYYFEKKRSMATGIAVAGSGVGTFVLPPLCIFLINRFGWRIAVCVLATLGLSSIIYGLLYRPLTTPAIEEEKKASKLDVEEMLLKPNEAKGKELDAEIGIKKEGSIAEGVKWQKPRTRNARSECEAHEIDEDNSLAPFTSVTENGASKLKNSSIERIPPRVRKNTATSVDSKMTSATDLKISRSNLANPLSKISARSYAQSISRLSQSSQIKGAQSLLSVASSVNPKEFNRPLNRRDIFYSGSIRNLPEFKSEGSNYQSYRESQTSIRASVAAQALSNISQVGDISDNQDKFGGSRLIADGPCDTGAELLDYYDDSKFKWIPETIRNAFNEMIDISLLKEPAMFLLCISNLFGMLGFYVPFMFLIDMAVAKGHSKSNGSLLLSVIGITNTIGRIVVGWVADRNWLSALTINNFALITCGLLTCLCPLLPGYAGLMIYSILFGFIISAYISLTSIVLVDELGLDRLTNSFGLLVVSRGIASLSGTPLAGIVYDLFASYDASFYFAGVIIVMSGLVSCLIPVFHRCKKDEPIEQLVEEARVVQEDNQSGKLSVLTEHSEENLTEYQRTIQSLRQQQKLLEELAEHRRLISHKKQQQQQQQQTVAEGDEDE